MFIVVLFGSKQQKIFTIDCLTATLIDCIWIQCIKEINTILQQKEEQHTKEITSLNKRIVKQQQKLTEVEEKIEEELQKEEPTDDKKKKDDKKKATKKGGKDQPPSNPLEQEKLDIENQIKDYNTYIEEYGEKLKKIAEYKEKFTALEEKQDVIPELLDKTGERKFVKTKLDIYANEFLTDKNTYVLSTITPAQTAEDEDIIDVCEVLGYCTRTCEEDKDAPPDEPLVVIQKDDKKKGKKGGKK